MKLTILGCNGPFAAPNSACSSYLLTSGDTNVLIDCGPGALAQLESIMSIGSLDAIILSHLHYDHISDLFSGAYNLAQLHAAGIVNRRIPLLLPDDPADIRTQLAAPVFEPISLDAFSDKSSDIQVGDIVFTAKRVRHPLPAFAVSAVCDGKKFVYTGDTNTCDGLVEFCRWADLLLCDAGLTLSQWSEAAPHLSSAHCGELARDAHVLRAVGTHINPRADRETLLSEMQKSYPKAELAHQGMTIEI